MRSNVIWALLAVICCLLIEIFFFRGFLLEPNAYMFPFGGDGYFITYNMNYHAQHGEGLQLNSMNYPFGEVIFMTDANGVLTTLVQQLRDWGLPTEHAAIGFMNVATYYLIPLCVLFLFLILRQLKLPAWYSAIGALFIGLLSPQIFRIVCGHYALGYPFLIPMVMYWIMRADNKGSWRVGGFFVALTLLLFGLNNFYLLLIGAGFCFLVGLIAFFGLPKMSIPFDRRQVKQISLTIMLVGILPLIVGYIFNESLSTHDDRVRVPYGFMRKFELLPSLVWTERSFIQDNLAGKLGLSPSGPESMSYLGMVPIIVFLILAFRAARGRFRSWKISDNPYFNLIFLSGLAFLLLAAHFPFYGPLRELGNQLPVFPQFRAEQRLIWAFYYAFTILMIYKAYGYLEVLAQKKKNGRSWAALALGVGVCLCTLDVENYLDSLNNEIFFPNHFSEAKNQEMVDFAEEFGISTDEYQGMYMLPTMNGWTDKVYHDGQWGTYFHGMRLCVATGIPMVNQMLSRVSVEQALQNLQFVSHPLVEREKIQYFPNKKPILLCRGEEMELHPREEWLITQGDTVAQGFGLVLLSYNPWEDDSYQKRQEARAYVEVNGATAAKPHLMVDFDESESPFIFYGGGAKPFEGKSGEHEIWVEENVSWPTDTSYEASIWVYPDRDRQGLPHWYLQQWNASGEITASADQWSVQSYDTQNGWVRTTINFDLLPETQKIRLVAKHPTDFWCDELLIRSQADTIVRQAPGEANFSFNNFLVEPE